MTSTRQNTTPEPETEEIATERAKPSVVVIPGPVPPAPGPNAVKTMPAGTAENTPPSE